MLSYDPYTDTNAIQKYQFLHHFLPHPETKKRAKLLSHTALLGYSLVMIFVIGAFHMIPLLAPGVLGYASNINISDLLNDTNKVRQENGLSTLRTNNELTLAAQKKAAHMFANDYWAHVAPDGTAPWDFILAENYDYSYAGENLAKNFNNSDQVVDAWFKSPSHRENLLNKNYDEIGFAVVNGVLDGYETTLVVQMFGRLRASAQPAAIPGPTEENSTQVFQQSKPIQNVVISSQALEEAQEPQILPALDVAKASKTISMLVGGFLLVLLVLDVWYTEKKAIPKVTGHAFSHIILLVVVLIGIWFVLSPGKIL